MVEASITELFEFIHVAGGGDVGLFAVGNVRTSEPE